MAEITLDNLVVIYNDWLEYLRELKSQFQAKINQAVSTDKRKKPVEAAPAQSPEAEASFLDLAFAEQAAAEAEEEAPKSVPPQAVSSPMQSEASKLSLSQVASPSAQDEMPGPILPPQAAPPPAQSEEPKPTSPEEEFLV